MNDLIERAKILLSKINIEERQTQIRAIEAESMDPDFWKDTQTSFQIVDLLKEINKKGTTISLASLLKVVRI